jgi:polyribonucleotide nucleotidyltransferase
VLSEDKLGASIRHENKIARHELIADLEDFVLDKFRDEYDEQELKLAFDEVIKKEVRRAILDDGVRPDDR